MNDLVTDAMRGLAIQKEANIRDALIELFGEPPSQEVVSRVCRLVIETHGPRANVELLVIGGVPTIEFWPVHQKQTADTLRIWQEVRRIPTQHIYPTEKH